MSASLVLTLGGFAAFAVGVGVCFGIGYALMVGGAICFVAGGLGSTREGR